MCGDATNPDHVGALMAGKLADCLWTDPPYNVDYTGFDGSRQPIANDRMSDSAFRSFLEAAFSNACLHMRAGASAYVTYASIETEVFHGAFVEAGFELLQVLVWVKDRFVLGRADYHQQHEPIIYGQKPAGDRCWFGTAPPEPLAKCRDPIFSRNADGSVTVRVGTEAIVLPEAPWEVQRVSTDVIEVDRPQISPLHPTMKPVELIRRLMCKSTKHGDHVIDLFGGSGSTLIACEEEGRMANVMELDAHYVDVAVQRLEEVSGLKAVRQ